MNPKQTRTPADKRLAVLLALLVQLAWPVAAWHEATADHAICPEHGEVLEVAASSECEGDHARQHWTGSEEHGEDHEICPLVVIGQPSSHAEAEGPCIVLLVAPSHEAMAATSRHAPIPLLLQSPKHSPPV